MSLKMTESHISDKLSTKWGIVWFGVRKEKKKKLQRRNFIKRLMFTINCDESDLIDLNDSENFLDGITEKVNSQNLICQWNDFEELEGWHFVVRERFLKKDVLKEKIEKKWQENEIRFDCRLRQSLQGWISDETKQWNGKMKNQMIFKMNWRNWEWIQTNHWFCDVFWDWKRKRKNWFILWGNKNEMRTRCWILWWAKGKSMRARFWERGERKENDVKERKSERKNRMKEFEVLISSDILF
jgi:hypothetical protein